MTFSMTITPEKIIGSVIILYEIRIDLLVQLLLLPREKEDHCDNTGNTQREADQ